MDDVERIVAGLQQFERDALTVLPLPRAANPVRLVAARTFSSLWRKASGHWAGMLRLESKGIVERSISRGETLWRPTRPLGLSFRAALEKEMKRDPA